MLTRHPIATLFAPHSVQDLQTTSTETGLSWKITVSNGELQFTKLGHLTVSRRYRQDLELLDVLYREIRHRCAHDCDYLSMQILCNSMPTGVMQNVLGVNSLWELDLIDYDPMQNINYDQLQILKDLCKQRLMQIGEGF